MRGQSADPNVDNSRIRRRVTVAAARHGSQSRLRLRKNPASRSERRWQTQHIHQSASCLIEQALRQVPARHEPGTGE